MDDDRIPIRFYHSGQLIKEPQVEYIGGRLDVKEKVDLEVVSIPVFEEYLEEFGCKQKVNKFYYSIPSLTTGLRVLDGDNDVIQMCNYAKSSGFLDIYTEHLNGSWCNMIRCLMDNELFIASMLDETEQEGNQIPFTSQMTMNSQVTSMDVDESTLLENLGGTSNGIPKANDNSDAMSLHNSIDVNCEVVKNGKSISESDSKCLEQNLVGNGFNGLCARGTWEWDDQIDTDDELGVGDKRIDSSIMSDVDEELESGLSRRKILKRFKELDFDNYPTYNPNIPSHDLILDAGLKFKSKEEVRDVILSIMATSKRGIEIFKSEKTRIQAKCMAGCPWYIWVAPMGTEDSWQIKSFCGEHADCHPVTVHKNIDHKWLAQKLYLKINPKMKTRGVISLAKDVLGVDISEGQAKRTKKLAIEEIQGSFTSQYSMLWDYAEELRRSNPGSTVKLLLDSCRIDQPPMFKRFYVCLKALKDGFRDGCRNVLNLDGCFLKGFISGMLLLAVGRDANNQMYPIAWSVVEVENTESWMWFVSLLQDDLKLGDGNGYSIISDQQKGLCTIIEQLLPAAEHRFCAVHIYGNWSKIHKGENLKLAFWSCVKATCDGIFSDAMATLKAYSKHAADDLSKIDPRHWCRALFSRDVKCDAYENNIVETFNGKIIEAREKPIISMLEEIRLYVMKRIEDQRKKALKCQAAIMPNIQKKVNEAMEAADKYDVFPSGNDEYQVRRYTYSCAVSLKEKTCGCEKWQLSGIPCEHACSAIRQAREKPYQYVHECYSPSTQIKIYSHHIAPINGEHLWKRTNNVEVRPPPIRKMPGRPKKARRKAPTQKGDRKKVSISGLAQKCSKCRQFGHSCKTCSKVVQTNNLELDGQPSEFGGEAVANVFSSLNADVCTVMGGATVTSPTDGDSRKQNEVSHQGKRKRKKAESSKRKTFVKRNEKRPKLMKVDTKAGDRGKVVINAMNKESMKGDLRPSSLN